MHSHCTAFASSAKNRPAEQTTEQKSALTKQRLRESYDEQPDWKEESAARWCVVLLLRLVRLFSKQNQTKQFLSQFSSAGVRSFFDIVNNDAKEQKSWITL